MYPLWCIIHLCFRYNLILKYHWRFYNKYLFRFIRLFWPWGLIGTWIVRCRLFCWRKITYCSWKWKLIFFNLTLTPLWWRLKGEARLSFRNYKACSYRDSTAHRWLIPIVHWSLILITTWICHIMQYRVTLLTACIILPNLFLIKFIFFEKHISKPPFFLFLLIFLIDIIF